MGREISAESRRNRSGLVLESLRKPSASLAESIQALSRLYVMQPKDFMQILR